MLTPIVCDGCGEALVPNRPDQKYHGAPCRLLAHRRHKRGQTTPERTARTPRLVKAAVPALKMEPAPRFGSLWTLLLGAMTLEQPLAAWKARDPQGYALAREQARTITANPALVYAAAVELGFAATNVENVESVEAHEANVEAHEANVELAELANVEAHEAHVEPTNVERRAKKKTTTAKRTASEIEGLRAGLQKAITQHGSQHAVALVLVWSQSTISKFLAGKPLSQEKREELAEWLNEKRL